MPFTAEDQIRILRELNLFSPDDIITVGEAFKRRHEGRFTLPAWWGELPAGFVEMTFDDNQREGQSEFHVTLHGEPRPTQRVVVHDDVVQFYKNENL